MQLIGAASWFPESCTQAIVSTAPTAYLWLAIVLFFLNIVVPAIVKDYVVRWWRGWIHRDEFERAYAKLARAEEALAAERAEFEATRTAVERLLPENDRLRLEVTALRMQLYALEPKRPDRALRPD